METLITYAFDELASNVQNTVLDNVRNSKNYIAYYQKELTHFVDTAIGEESNELLENKVEYIITDTDILIQSVYEGGNLDLEKLYYFYVLGDVTVYANETFTVKINYDTEPIRNLVNTFQEDIKEWAIGVLSIVEERKEVFKEELLSDAYVAQYIRDNNYIFTENGQEININ